LSCLKENIMLLLRAGWALALSVCCELVSGQVPTQGAVRILLGEVPGLCSSDGREGKVCVPVQEAIRSSGLKTVAEVVPFARMIHTAAGAVPTLVAPLGRTPDREQRFWFVQHLYNDDLVVWRLRSEPVRLHGSSIVVMRGSAAIEPLVQLGARVTQVSSDAVACRMLRAGRADAWVGTRAARTAGCRDQFDLVEDQVLMALPIYAAVPVGTPLEKLAPLLSALKPARLAHTATGKPS
jgi:polar amino acid transport system substrate-binding protein